MEEILKKLLEGQSRTEKKLSTIQDDITNIKDDMTNLKDDIINIKSDMTNIKGDMTNIQGNIKTIKETINRIENHQEESLMGILNQIKKQAELKDSQIQVLNKRLFTVETKTEQTQQ